MKTVFVMMKEKNGILLPIAVLSSEVLATFFLDLLRTEALDHNDDQATYWYREMTVYP